MKFYIKTVCPYCGLKNENDIEKNERFYEHKIVYCDSDIGGCDRYYVIGLSLSIDVDVYKLEEANQNEQP